MLSKRHRLPSWFCLNKMKNLITLLFMIAPLYALSAPAVIHKEHSNKVFYFSFDIDRLTGIPEHQIEEYGCLYNIKITQQRFESMLAMPSCKFSYDERDVRAKVIFDDIQPYFINIDGVVRHGDNFFIIDKKEFENNLLFKECKTITDKINQAS